jgi:hypothetical protein
MRRFESHSDLATAAPRVAQTLGGGANGNARLRVHKSCRRKIQGREFRRRYAEDTSYAWLKRLARQDPVGKIVQDHAPDGQPCLFMLAGTMHCFTRPKGGL